MKITKSFSISLENAQRLSKQGDSSKFVNQLLDEVFSEERKKEDAETERVKALSSEERKAWIEMEKARLELTKKQEVLLNGKS
jgi:hypothetical protein